MVASTARAVCLFREMPGCEAMSAKPLHDTDRSNTRLYTTVNSTNSTISTARRFPSMKKDQLPPYTGPIGRVERPLDIFGVKTPPKLTA